MGTSSAQLLFGHQLHSQLDVLLPSIADKVQCNQNLQKQIHDYHARDGQLHAVRRFSFSKEPWARTTLIPGKILKQSGAVTFMVELTDGTVISRRNWHILITSVTLPHAFLQINTKRECCILLSNYVVIMHTVIHTVLYACV